MITISSSMRACARMATAVALLGIGAANAAEDQASANAPAQVGVAAASQAPQASTVALNSGASPHEFPSDPGKVTLERRADGTRVYHMNGQGMEAVTARIGADGKLELRCSAAGEKVLPQATAEQPHEN